LCDHEQCLLAACGSSVHGCMAGDRVGWMATCSVSRVQYLLKPRLRCHPRLCPSAKPTHWCDLRPPLTHLRLPFLRRHCECHSVPQRDGDGQQQRERLRQRQRHTVSIRQHLGNRHWCVRFPRQAIRSPSWHVTRCRCKVPPCRISAVAACPSGGVARLGCREPADMGFTAPRLGPARRPRPRSDCGVTPGGSSANANCHPRGVGATRVVATQMGDFRAARCLPILRELNATGRCQHSTCAPVYSHAGCVLHRKMLASALC
jgi:hypothetical protein